jgi:dihydrofolate reductase
VLKEITDNDPGRVFVIGGGEIYILFLPLCTYAYVTKIDITPPSDTFFPYLDCQPNWTLVHRDIRTHAITEKELPGFAPCDEEYNRNIVRYSFDLYKNQDKSKRDN